MNNQKIIDDVELKMLVRHYDERGYFQEIIRETDSFFKGFGQWSSSMMYNGIIKAFHLHTIQYDYWYVPFGVIKAALYDLRDGPTFHLLNEFMMGDNYDPFILKIPPGVAHGLKVVQGPAHLFYVTSEVYNPKDEGRLPHDDKAIGYDWLKGPDIK